MKRFVLSFLISCITILSFAQGTESFTNIPAANSSYTARTWTGDNGLPWTASDARTDQTITGPAIAIRLGAVSCANIPNGIGNLSFKYQQVFTGANPVLEVRVNGVLVGTVTPTANVESATLNNINVSGNFTLEIKQTTASLRVKIDDITWSNYNASPCVAPTAQPTNFKIDSVSANNIAAGFTAATPAADQYLVVLSTSSTLSATPVDGTVYEVEDEIGNGVVIAKGNVSSFTKASLASGTTYYIYIFALNSSCTGGPLYNTAAPLTGTATTTTPPACVAPSSAPGALTFSATSNSVSGSFADAAGADGYLVVRSTSGTMSFTPANGTSYTTGQVVGASSDGIVVSAGAGNSFTSAGLNPSTQYYFYVYPVSGFACVGGPLYFTTSSNGTATTSAAGSTGEPTGYYTTASGKTCATLKSALRDITSNMTPKTYADLYVQYTKTDIKPNENGPGMAIWDIYSDNPTGVDPYNFIPGNNQCGSYSKEGDCYNREHSFPQSWFGGGTSPGPGTDYHHIFPTDGKVNGVRSNFIYGEVASASSTSLNGSKLGSSAIAGLNGTVFEPINEYKGDVARAFLYMVTRYENNIPAWANISGSQGQQALDANTYPSVDIPYLKLMIKWAQQDPVSTKEINRNNGAYVFQGNRNPYIDHPEYVDLVWNSNCSGLSTLPVDIISFTGKLQDDKVRLQWVAENEVNFATFEIERSFNGTSYKKIGAVTAANLHAYSYNDDANAIRGQRVYYRLKKVDKDGKFKYSEVLSLHIPLNNKFSVYPNPARGSIQLQFNKNISGTVSIQVADLAGKTLKQENASVNGSTAKVSAAGLTSGTYLIKVTMQGEQYLQKVVVVN